MLAVRAIFCTASSFGPRAFGYETMTCVCLILLVGRVLIADGINCKRCDFPIWYPSTKSSLGSTACFRIQSTLERAKLTPAMYGDHAGMDTRTLPSERIVSRRLRTPARLYT